MKKHISFSTRFLTFVVGFLIMGGAWKVMGHIFLPALFPGIHLILLSLYKMLFEPELQSSALYSIGNVYIGVLIASLFSVIIAILMNVYNWFSFSVSVPVDVFRNIAALSLYPLFLVIFGISREAHIAIIIWNTWANVLLTTYNALVTVEKEVLEAAQLDGATVWQLMFHMKLPLVLPHVLLAIRVAFGLGWFAIIVSEMLGGTRGLGFLVMHYSNAFDFSRMYAVIIFTSACGYLMSFVWVKLTIVLTNRFL